MKNSARSGFTLIEVIIVLVIMAVIMGTAVLSVSSGMRSAAVRDAARTVQLYVRHAKAVALLKQRPVVLQFEEVNENGEFVKSRISLTFSGDAQGGGQGIGMARGAMAADGLTRTLSGQLVGAEAFAGDDVMPSASPSAGDAPDPLMAEPREFQGVRISAMLQDETQTRPRISVFSNVDVLLKKKAAETERAKEKERAAAEAERTREQKLIDARQRAEEAYVEPVAYQMSPSAAQIMAIRRQCTDDISSGCFGRPEYSTYDELVDECCDYLDAYVYNDGKNYVIDGTNYYWETVTYDTVAQSIMNLSQQRRAMFVNEAVDRALRYDVSPQLSKVSESSNPLVYVSALGGNYHYDRNCSGLAGTGDIYEIPRYDAITGGFHGCDICK